MAERLVIYCEDNSFVSNMVTERLHRRTLHRIGAVAPDLATAFELLDKVSKGEFLDPRGVLDPKIVLLVDGELKGYNEGDNHPRDIYDRAKKLGIEVPIVGLSEKGLAYWGLEVGVHIAADITKEEFGKNWDIVGQTLDALPEPEPRTP